MPYTKFLYHMNELDFLKEPYKASQPKKSYEVKGEVFNTMLDVSKLTTAQYLDYIALLEAKDYKRLLNCLFIKEGEQYGDNDYSDLLWNSMTLDCYADTLFFFRNSLTTLTHNILPSSLRKMRRQVRRVRKEERLPYLRKMVQMKQALLIVDEDE